MNGRTVDAGRRRFLWTDEAFDKILKQVVKVCRKVEPDCRIIL